MSAPAPISAAATQTAQTAQIARGRDGLHKAAGRVFCLLPKRVLLKNKRMAQWDINIPVIHGGFKADTQSSHTKRCLEAFSAVC